MQGRTAAQSRRTAWLIVFLLFLAQMLNYFDKTVVGVAATSIMAELDLTSERYGLVASAFFSLYAVTGVLVALFAAPRFKPRSIMAVLLVIWSLAQLPVLVSASFTTLIAGRVILGMGEGPGTPTSINACHEWFAPAERNMPTALSLFGSQVGSLLAAPILSYIIAGFGWRAAFLACSAAGFVILVLWLRFSADGPEAAHREVGPATGSSSPIRQRDLWADPSVIGNFVAGFAAYWVVGFTVAWLPLFVRNRLGLGLIESGWVLSAIYLVQALLLLLIAFGSQRMLRAGATSRAARGIVMASCLLISAAAFIGAAMATDAHLAVVLVTIGTALPLVIFTLGAAMLSEVSPTAHRNRLVTIIFSIVTLSAIPSPLVTGALVQGDLGWDRAFLVLAAVTLIGGIISWATLRPERSIRRLVALEG
ncbi:MULTISPECIES: MFS transporter [unclassified Sphingomonas]|uniref:MFS transporter n=1 Tax=unclassified Sphingomonas TaxID=196159 RepID=UPI001F381774|nr:MULTISPECIES: MFS transporter [unclassified Sphingomonas]